MQNFIQFQAWAETNVNFLYRVRAPFNESLTNDVVSFEQLGPDHYLPFYLVAYSSNNDNTLHITKTRLYKYIENFTSKNWKFSHKKLRYFSNFCSKHRLWVLVRTASPICSKHRLWYSLEPPRKGGSNEYQQSMFWAEIRKNPSFSI